MPKFKYKAVGSNGQVIKGELSAPSQQAAINSLQNAGHLPISAQEIDTNKKLQEQFLQFFQRRDTVRQKDIVILMGELATLLHAGLPLDHALKTMEGISSSQPIKNLLNTILQRVQGGANLSDAMEEQGSIFSRLQINMIRAGEAGGSLHTVIERLAIYLERMSELRSTVTTALIYPAILLIIAFLSLFILMTFVVPQFIPLFEDAGQTLPLITQIVFSTAELFKTTWWIILCLFTLSIWIIDKQLAIPAKRKQFDAWCLRLPHIGDLIMQMETARFTRTLGTLMNNGVPLLSAVRLVRDVINNRVMSEVMNTVVAHLEQGQRLAKPLRESKLFPPLTVQLVEVGEESGDLEEMLIKIADIYDKAVQTSIKRMLTLLEPVLILGLGILIAVIIFSILVPMISMNELVT